MHPDHLDERRIQELLHGELPGAEEAWAREHANACPDCARRLEEAEAEDRLVGSLLATLDRPVPPVRVEDVVNAASRLRAREIPARRQWNRWAAGVLLALGVGGVAYAIPGSPVRGWVNGLIPAIFVRESPSEPDVRGSIPSATSLGGIALEPGPRLLVSFERPRGGRVVISLVEGEHVVVRAPSGRASFESGQDRLVIDARADSTTFEIDIPRSAPWVEIRSGGARIFLKDGDRTEPPLAGPYARLPLGASGP